MVPVQLPFGGMNREFGFERQKPATTPHCINVWPRQARRRYSIGARPGLKRFYNGVAAGSVNLLAQTDLNEATYLRYIDDDFDGYSKEGRWNSGVGGLTAPTLDFLNHLYYADYHASNKYGFILDALNYELTEPVYVTLKVLPYNGQNAATYRVYFLLNDVTPNPADAGIEVVLTLSKVSGNDRLTWTINCYDSPGAHVSGSPYTNTFDTSLVDARTIRVMYDYNGGTETVSIFLDYVQVVSQTVNPPTSGYGERIGFSMAATSTGGRAIVDRVRVQWTDDDDTRVTNVGRMVMGGGGKIYHESIGNDIAEVNSSWSLLANEPVTAATRLNKLYIADWGDILYEDTDATVRTISGTGPYVWGFEANPNTVNLVSLGIDVTNFVVEVVAWKDTLGNEITPTRSDGKTIPAGVYSFNAFTSGGTSNNRISLTRQSAYDYTQFYADTSGSPASSQLSMAHIRIRRGPKIYDASAGTLAKLERSTSADLTDETENALGSIPVGCHGCAEYGDRLVLIDDSGYYASRIGDFVDFNYGVDPFDPAKAWAGTLAEAGSLGRRPTAVIAFSDDFLLIAAEDMILRMIGDIGFGGRIEVASRSVGIIGPLAWCIIPDGRLFFMARDGMYVMSPGGGQYAQPASKDPLPDELRNLSEHSTMVSLVYDQRYEAIQILIGGKRENQHRDSWHFDLKSGAFWPWRTFDGIEPTVGVTLTRAYFYGQVQPLIGCRDGRVRAFDRSTWLDGAGKAADDDPGTAVDSILSMGPFRAGPNATAVRALDVNLSHDSRPTYITVETDDTPEEAVKRAEVGTSYDFRHTLSGGRNRGVTARGAGGAAMISIRSISGGPWAIEDLWASLVPVHRAL